MDCSNSGAADAAILFGFTLRTDAKEDSMREPNLTRRDFLRLAAVGAAGAVVAACGGGTPPAEAPTAAPANAVPNAAAGAEAATAEAPTAGAPAGAAATPIAGVPRGQPKDVPREKSLIIMWGVGQPGIGNPYAPGFNFQQGTMSMHEPLYFFSAYGSKTIPWLADGDPKYAPDFTDVTINIRKGVEWSDGQPFSARDVAFTLTMLRDSPKLPNGADMKKWVKDATAVDDNTLKISFNQPAPRFVFDFLNFKFDLGILFVPEHIFKDQKNVVGFLFYDPAKGWPVTTGPYKIVDWTPQRQLYDLRPEWWAAKTGFQQLPKVERIVTLPFPAGDTTPVAQALIKNQIDTSLDLRPPVIKTVVDQNPKMITHTGRQAPYGYTDWWPNSLWFNDTTPPFDDPEIRQAINYAIDRKQVVDLGYEGAGIPTDLPFPGFPSLQQYFDAAKPLLEKYPTSAFDPAKSEEIMTKKGYTKDANALWAKDGKKIDLTIYGFDIFADYGPVLAEQLHNAGFDASFKAPPDAYDRMSTGSANAFLFGHGGAIADVYPTLDLFHSRHNQETGNIKARWTNPDYDTIVDQLALLPVGDPKGIPLYLQALEIYLKEKPELPIVQWLHRIPMNTTYWTGWPTQEDPYINPAHFHLTFQMVMHRLSKAAAAS
jgi:peptide/nickel transport system substrate-binding protein